MSKSCQNLSFGQEFDQQRSNHIKNHILSSPSLSSVQDLGGYDPRRSSTPLHKNPPNRDDKNKRRSASNAWARGPVVSPLASPVRYNRTQSQQGKDSPSKHINNLPSKTRHSSENILSEKYDDGVPRRSGNKNRPRPKSLMVDRKAEREFFEQLKAEEASHSDNEIDMKSNLREFTDANETRPSPELSPVRSLVRNFDIDEQMAERLDATYDSNSQNIGKMAAEINSNMTSLTMQALKQHADEDATNDEPHAGTSKRLIQLYESGLLMNGNIHQDSPPPMRKSSSSHVSFCGYVSLTTILVLGCARRFYSYIRGMSPQTIIVHVPGLEFTAVLNAPLTRVILFMHCQDRFNNVIEVPTFIYFLNFLQLLTLIPSYAYKIFTPFFFFLA